MGFCKNFCEDFIAGSKIVAKNLKGSIGGLVFTATGLVVLAMNGIDISKTFGYTCPAPNGDFCNAWDSFVRIQTADPDKLAEEGIQKIAESSKSYDFDANLLCAAREIRDIAKRTGSGYRAKSTALTALSEIAGRCDFDGSKKQIAGLIKEIATSM